MTSGLWDDPGTAPDEATNRRLDDLDQAVRELTDTLDSVLTAPAAAAHGPRAHLGRPRPRRRHRSIAGGLREPGAPWWNRVELSADEAAELDEQVRSFGEWVRATYKIRHFPDRWPADPALAAEVLALYAGWRGAYSRPGAFHHEPGQWHDALARFITRTEQYMTRLRQTETGPPPAQ